MRECRVLDEELVLCRKAAGLRLSIDEALSKKRGVFCLHSNPCFSILYSCTKCTNILYSCRFYHSTPEQYSIIVLLTRLAAQDRLQLGLGE